MAFSSLGCHNLQFVGKRAKPAEAPILVLAPHCGFFDSYPHFWLGAPSYVGEKQFIDNTPFLGSMMKMSEPIAVDRNDKESRAQTVELIRDRAEKLVSEPYLNWPQLVLFPEGTCTNLKSLVGFKIGAFNPAVPVQPVCIQWCMPYNHISWCYDAPGQLTLMWLTACQLETRIIVHMLPVHTPTEEEKNDADLYAENVRKEMANCLGIPVSPFVYEDSRSIAHSVKPRPDLFWKYFDSCGLSRPSTKGVNVMRETWLNLTRSRFPDSSFQATLQQFAEYTKVQEVDWTFRRLFNCFNWNFVDSIDLREYLIACFAEPGLDYLKLSFEMMASGSDRVNDTNFVVILRLPYLMSIDDCYNFYDQLCEPGKSGVSFGDLYSALARKPEFYQFFEE